MFALFKYFKKKDWITLLLAVVLIATQVVLDLKLPDFTSKLTTILQGENAVMREVWINGGLMLACAVASLASAMLCSFLIAQMSSSFSMTLREKLFSKICSFSSAEMKKFSVPSLITRTTNDVMQVQNFMAMGVQMLVKAPIMAICAIYKISATNVKWTTAVIISVCVIVVCISVLVGMCIPRFKQIQKLTDEINNVTRESISGVRVVRAFNAEKYQEQRFEKVNEEITKNHLFTSRSMGLMSPIMTVVMNGLMLAIYWIGAILINNVVLGGDIQGAIAERVQVVGNMTAFTQYAMHVVMSFMVLIVIFIILPRTIISGNRINQVLKTDSSILNGNFKEVTEKVGEIEFKNVSFSYPDAEGNEKALTDISFKIEQGQTLAIIGPTGSAKTTLINLIPRFYDVTDGEVLVDGVNVKEYDEKVLRNKISIASQKAVLFKGSIKSNIVFGEQSEDKDKIDKVLEISNSKFVGCFKLVFE